MAVRGSVWQCAGVCGSAWEKRKEERKEERHVKPVCGKCQATVDTVATV